MDGLLSFAPDTPEIELLPLNVLIGPNGSGKSNLIEIIELLRAAPSGISSAIREGGGIREWIWKGCSCGRASIEVQLAYDQPSTDLRYMIEFAPRGERAEVWRETLVAGTKALYRQESGMATIDARSSDGTIIKRELSNINPFESVLSQRKDPDQYPELTWCAVELSRIQVFRDWCFGCFAAPRRPQRTDLAHDSLSQDCSNLALLVNELEQTNASEALFEQMSRFLPGFKRLATITRFGTIQLLLHEEGLREPIPAQRLSDGTLRFIALLVTLLTPNPPPLVCIEEPELGLHPDALSLVANLLVDASQRTQIMVTTHSSALLSSLSLEADSVLVCENLGGTQVRRLKPDDLEGWLDRYRLGELWRIGAIGGNP